MKTTIKKTISKKLLSDEQIADMLDCLEIALTSGTVDKNIRKTCRKIILDSIVIYQRANLQEATFNVLSNNRKVDSINKKVATKKCINCGNAFLN